METTVRIMYSALTLPHIESSTGADTEALPVANSPMKANRAKDLFREHYPKLQQIKRKYDPDMVFNKWFVVEPATA